MNKNFESYKSTYSRLRPSDEAVERAMDITNEKKRSFNPVFKRLAAAVLALAVLIGGGFGISFVSQDNDNTNELGVLVAYASTGEFLDVGSVSEQELFYSLHIAPMDNEKAAKKAREKYNADWEKVNEGYVAAGSGNYLLVNDSDETTAELFRVEAGLFALSLDDYSEVETFKIENSGIYGNIMFDYDFFGKIGITGKLEEIVEKYDVEDLEELLKDNFPENYTGHEIEISGETLRRSQESEFYSTGTSENAVNKGYTLRWAPSWELLDAIGNNTKFNLSKIKDTITFTVVFKDGSVKSASIDLYFDSDGYMHFCK